jgi:hypothetical protein
MAPFGEIMPQWIRKGLENSHRVSGPLPGCPKCNKTLALIFLISLVRILYATEEWLLERIYDEGNVEPW